LPERRRLAATTVSAFSDPVRIGGGFAARCFFVADALLHATARRSC